MNAGPPPSTVVFDLGGVLVNWDPRHLYRQLFDDPEEMESFLAEVTTAEWNARQDAGRPWALAVELLAAEHPERRDLIEAFHRRWPEMLAGEIPGTVEVLADLRAEGVRLFALSNWSADTFPVARERFDFLAWFDGIVISGEVGVNKPDRRIFEHLLEQFGIEPEATLFIDDSSANVDAAIALGFRAIRFTDATALRIELVRLGLLPHLGLGCHRSEHSASRTGSSDQRVPLGHPSDDREPEASPRAAGRENGAARRKEKT
jgi:2-haloacid dehalogenase